LSLGDDIAPLDAWNDCSLLDGRRLLETVSVDSSQEFLFQVHGVEIVDDFIPVGLDDASNFHSCWSIVGFLRTVIIPADGERSISENFVDF
jgi:hypothetical protein